MRASRVSASQGRFRISAQVLALGDDLLVAITGGTRPHIGAVGVAVPRPSLKDPRRWSATSSNFTFTGHKEDLLAKEVSEGLAGALRRNVVVTAGIHWDHLGPADLQVIQGLTRTLTQKIVDASKPQRRRRTT